MIKKITMASLLLTLCVVAPVLAQPYPSPDVTYYVNPWNLDGGNALKITVTHVVASDVPLGSYGINYPPSIYRYYVVYYLMENPNDAIVPYQYNITLVDTNGTEYRTFDEITGSHIPAHFRSTDTQPVEYVIPRNATITQLKSYFINNYTNTREWETRQLSTQTVPSPTPSATPSATAAPTPTPTPGATATPKPAPADGLLPLLAVGIVGAGIAFVRGGPKRK